MVVGQRQPQLSLKPREALGKAIGSPSQATIALTLSQIVTFDIAGIDGAAGWQSGQLLGYRLEITEDHFAVHLNKPPILPRLHDLGVQQLGWWHEKRFGIAASIPVAWRLMQQAIGMQQSPSILGQLITGKKRNVRIRDVTDTIEQ